MTFKGNQLHAARGEQGNVCDLRQVVRVDEQLELWPELKAVFMQEAGGDRIIAGQGFDQRGTQDHLLIGLGDIDEPGTGQPGHILTWHITVDSRFHGNCFRSSGAAIVPHKVHEGFHAGALAVAAGYAVQDEEAFMRRVTGQGIAQRLLKECGLVLIALHDLGNKLLPTLTAGICMVFNTGLHAQEVRRGMISELPCFQVQGAVLAVEQEGVCIESGQGQRVHAGRVLQNGFAVVAALPLGNVLHVALLPGFIRDGQRINIKAVCQFLAKLHDLQAAGVGLPHAIRINEPLFALWHIPGNALVPICEQVAVSDVIPAVSVVIVGFKVGQ